MTVLVTWWKTGSSGFGVSGTSPRIPRSSRSTIGAGARASRSNRSRIARASAKGEASGAVGPEAMTSSGSPMTSESRSAGTRAGAAARASWPPLSSEQGFRTALSWLLFAPAAWSSRADGRGRRGSGGRTPSAPPRGGSRGELLQPAPRLDQHVVGLGEAEADLGPPELAVGVEGRARHRGDPDLPDQVEGELVVVLAAEALQEVLRLGEDVVRAAGPEGDEARLLHLAQQEIAPGLVALPQMHVVRGGQAERGARGFLERVRRPDGE